MVHTLSRARHDRGTASASVSHHPLIRYNRQSRRRGYYPVHPHTLFSTLNSVGSRRIIDAGIHRRDAKWHLAETDFHPPIQSGHRRLRRRRSTHAGGGARSKEACGPSLACKRSPSFRVENSLAPRWSNPIGAPSLTPFVRQLGGVSQVRHTSTGQETTEHVQILNTLRITKKRVSSCRPDIGNGSNDQR